MAMWHIKPFSELTQVSVRTLHHYDRIDLLKPSLRQPNGYRLYSEADLFKLQQIIALKFFGFGLSQIKTLLAGNLASMEQLAAQSRLLAEKAETLSAASDTLKKIIASCDQDKSIPWETVIKLFEVYRMTQQLEHTWVSKILTPEELKEFISFEQSLKTRFSNDEKKEFEHAWSKLIADIEANPALDPTSEKGMQLGQRCMALVNNLYGKKHAALRTSIWEKGYKQGKMEDEHALSPRIVSFLDQAISAFYKKRIYELLAKVGTISSESLQQQWKDLLEEMHGNMPERDAEVCKLALADPGVSEAAKTWLKQHSIKKIE